MSKTKQAFLFIVVALLALAAGIYLHPLNRQGDPIPAAAPAGFLDTAIADLSGNKTPLSTWKGKVLVINFWATWCAPCRKEIPEFVRMQERLGGRGLQFVGIAIDEADKVAPFVKEVGINYPILVGEVDAAELSRLLGNEAGALPFTVVVDREGRVVKTELGATSEAKLGAVVEPLL
jgi:thiol-disulfide isomerase/thioredoxin